MKRLFGHCAWTSRRLFVAAACTVIMFAVSPAHSDTPDATLRLDFSSPEIFNTFKALQFSRSSSATYFDKQGFIRKANPDEPRIEFDPYLCNDRSLHSNVDWQCDRMPRGIAIEETRTNYVPNSEDLSKWQVYPQLPDNGPHPDFKVAKALETLTPDQLRDAWKLISPMNNDQAFVLYDVAQVPRSTSGADYVMSFFIRDVNPQWQAEATTPSPRRLTVRLGNNTGGYIVDVRRQLILPDDPQMLKRLRKGGTPTQADKDARNQALLGRSYGVMPISKGWYRVWLRYHVPEALLNGPQAKASLEMRIRLNKCEETLCSDPIIWGLQLEKGNYPTSYIPTSGAPAVRTEDALWISNGNGQPLGFYNPARGNFLIEAESDLMNDGHFSYLFDMQFAGNLRQTVLTDHGARSLAYYSTMSESLGADKRFEAGGLNEAPPNGELMRVGLNYKIAGSQSRVGLTINGGAEFNPTRPLTTPADLEVIRLGYYPKFTRSLNGHIRRFEYRPVELSAAQQTIIGALGFRPTELEDSTIGETQKWKRNADLSEECAADADPESGISHAERWVAKDLGTKTLEDHICSYRYKENVKIASQMNSVEAAESSRVAPPLACRFITGKIDGKVTTGSMWTIKGQTYGYFTSRYKVNGGMRTHGADGKKLKTPVPNQRLNNAFWLMSFTATAGKTKSLRKEYEIDVNEGAYPNLVRTNLRDHTPYIVDSGYAQGYAMPDKVFWWRDPREMTMADNSHVFSVLWTPTRFFYYVDDILIREMPNYIAHRDAYVYFSTAMLKSTSLGCDGIDPDVGKDVLVDYIRSYKAD